MATAGQSTDVEKRAESVKEVEASKTEMEVLSKEGEKVSEEMVAKVEEKSVEECEAEQVEAKSAEAGCSKTEEHPDLSDSSASSRSSSRVKLLGGYSSRVAETAEVAKVAAKTARDASLACQMVMQASLEAIATGKKQIETALQRVEDAAESDEADHYRHLAAEYGRATCSVTAKADDIETAAYAADAAATKADEAIAELSGIEDENTLDAKEKIEVACWATTTASAAAIVAFKTEFIALTEMKRCWQHIDDVEIMGSSVIHRRRLVRQTLQDGCDNPRDRLCLKIINGIVFIFGCIILAFLDFFKFSQQAHDGLLTVGIMFVSWPILQGLYNLFMRYRNKKLEEKVNKARGVIANIDKRLAELSNYFENNSINLILDSDQE